MSTRHHRVQKDTHWYQLSSNGNSVWSTSSFWCCFISSHYSLLIKWCYFSDTFIQTLTILQNINSKIMNPWLQGGGWNERLNGDLQNERSRDFYGCVCVLNTLSVSYEDIVMTSNCFYHYFIDTPTCSPAERRFPLLIFFMAISETTPLFVLMQVIRSILKIELFIREIRQRMIQ